jgi:hypothetical protein
LSASASSASTEASIVVSFAGDMISVHALKDTHSLRAGPPRAPPKEASSASTLACVNDSGWSISQPPGKALWRQMYCGRSKSPAALAAEASPAAAGAEGGASRAGAGAGAAAGSCAQPRGGVCASELGQPRASQRAARGEVAASSRSRSGGR